MRLLKTKQQRIAFNFKFIYFGGMFGANEMGANEPPIKKIECFICGNISLISPHDNHKHNHNHKHKPKGIHRLCYPIQQRNLG